MDNFGSEFLGVGQVHPDPSWKMSPHWHPFHEIIVVSHGVLHLKIEGETIRALAGDVLFYHAGRIHEERSDAGSPVSTHFLSLHMDSAALPTRLYDEGGRIRQLIAWLLQDHRAETNRRILGVLLATIVEQMKHLASAPLSPWLAGLRQKMRQHLTDDLDLNAVAEWAEMSKSACVRKYQRLSGCTPMRDLRLMRLDHARNLLLSTNLPLKAIADASHLGDESQFSKLFHRHYQLRPGEVRIRRRNKIRHP